MDIEREAPATFRSPMRVTVPRYMHETYWWAYIHPSAVRFFERQWLVNLILWGNFARLRNAALDELGQQIRGRTLQVACVYGDLTTRLVQRLAPDAWLDVIDVLPIQLSNLRAKLPANARATPYLQDSSDLAFADASYDQVLVFFLLHEQPEAVRRRTLHEALRVLKPGGKLVIFDYHSPSRLHPLRWLMRLVLRTLEPFALDLWRHDIATWLPEGVDARAIRKRTWFGGLYQELVIEAPSP